MTVTTPGDNPLLDFSGLPRFDAIAPSDVQPAISRLLDDCRALIERLTSIRAPRPGTISPRR